MIKIIIIIMIIIKAYYLLLANNSGSTFAGTVSPAFASSGTRLR